MNHEEDAREFEQAAANARWTATREDTDPLRVPGLLNRAAVWENEARKARLAGYARTQAQIRVRADANGLLSHGRIWAYNSGCRCEACCQANRNRGKRKDASHRASRVEIDGKWVSPGAPHGTIAGYTHHCCRCEACAQARRDYYENRPRRASA